MRTGILAFVLAAGLAVAPAEARDTFLARRDPPLCLERRGLDAGSDRDGKRDLGAGRADRGPSPKA